MKLELSQKFSFEAAHTLTRLVPLEEYEPSKRIHGHSYVATIAIKGYEGKNGMVAYFKLPKNKEETVDLFYLKKEIAKIKNKLDHRFLNEIDDLPHQTLESLCIFIYNNIKKTFPIAWVKVERPVSGDACIFYGDS